MFSLYSSTASDLAGLISLLTAALYYLAFVVPLAVLRYFLHQRGRAMSAFAVLGLPALPVAMNYAFNLYIGIAGFSALYLAFACYYFKGTDKKSIRWLGFSYLLFMWFALASYNYFYHRVSNLSWSFFAENDITEFEIDAKPYFAIKLDAKKLNTHYFMIGTTDEFRVTNNEKQARVLVFYYSMNVLLLVFWLALFVEAMKRHGIRLRRPALMPATAPAT